jgi:SAM-dependent methyltransferase
MDVWARWLGVDRFRGIGPVEAEAGRAFLAGVRARLLREADLRPGATVLEIGCGAGEFLPDLLTAVGPHGQVFALDHSPALCALAQQALGEHPLRHRARVDCGDMRAIPHGDGVVDAVVCRSVLQYAGEDLGRVAAEIARVLRPGGRLVAFEALPGDGAPLLPLARTAAGEQARERARARWAALPYALSRAALVAAFAPPHFCPVSLTTTLIDAAQPFDRAAFAAVLEQVPRPGVPPLGEIYAGHLDPEERRQWEDLLSGATVQAQRGAWAFLHARRAPAGEGDPR